MPELAEGFFVWFQYEMLHEKSKERVNDMREISETVTHRSILTAVLTLLENFSLGLRMDLQFLKLSDLLVSDSWPTVTVSREW
jgi:hypothetical protein